MNCKAYRYFRKNPQKTNKKAQTNNNNNNNNSNNNNKQKNQKKKKHTLTWRLRFCFPDVDRLSNCLIRRCCRSSSSACWIFTGKLQQNVIIDLCKYVSLLLPVTRGNLLHVITIMSYNYYYQYVAIQTTSYTCLRVSLPLRVNTISNLNYSPVQIDAPYDISLPLIITHYKSIEFKCHYH